MAEAASLEVGVSTNLASLYTGLAQAADRIGQFGAKVNRQLDDVGRAFDKLGGYLQILGVSLGAAAFAAGIKGAIDYADHLNDLSKSTGIAVETLGGLGFAAKQNGIDLETVAKGVQKLSQNMAAAAAGNAQLADVFQRMGVSIKGLDGNLRPLDQVLADVADKFQSYKDGPEKAALATELFKKGGEALIPLLDEGGQKLRELVAEYQAYGGVTTEVAQRSDTFNDTLEKIKLLQGALFRDIASALLPTLQALANIFLEAKVRGDGFSATAQVITTVIKGLGVAAVSVVGAFQAVGQSIGTLVGAIIGYFKGDSLSSIWNGLKEGFADAWASVGTAANRAATIWNADTATIATATENNLGNKATAPIKRLAQVVKDSTSSLSAYLKSLTDIELAYAGALAKSQVQAFSSIEADLKRQYDRGVIDFTEYYRRLVAVQKASNDAQVQEARAQVNAQQGLVNQLQAAFDSLRFDPNKYKTFAQFQNDQLKAQTALNEANAKLITLQGALNDKINDGAEIGAGYIEDFLVPASQGLLKLNSDLDQQIATLARQNEEIGLTTSQIAELNVQRVEEARANAILTGAGPEIIAFYDGQIDRLKRISDLAQQGEFKQKWVDGWRDLFQSAADRGASFIEDFVQHGGSAFKSLWNDFKSWALAAFAKIAAQTIIVNIAGAFSPQLAGIASNTFGQSLNPLQLLSGASSNLATGGLPFGISGGISGIGDYFTSGGVFGPTGAFAGFAQTPLAQTLGISTGALDTFGVGLQGGTAALTGFGTALGAAIPIIGGVLAIGAAAGLFSHEPSQVHARFNVTPTGTGASQNEGGAGGTASSPFGDLGFNDADTMYFSGSAGKILSDVVSGALQAFATRFSTDQISRLSTTLQGTDFGVKEGTYTTEDFIKTYGGEILQKVVAAAFHELDPALESVAANFTGTADDVAKFANSLLAIYDATKSVDNEDFTKNVDAALQGADQATADKILAFVTIVQSAGDALDGLGQHMQTIDPANMTKFVDALGGAQQALQGLAFINANFTTSAEKATAAQNALAKSWDAAGITADDLADANLTTFPQTHEQFLALLNSIDVNSEHGRDLAATLINTVAPAFVAVQGTADAAAQALLQQAQAGRDYYTQHFLSPAEQLTQRQSVDETKLFEATQAGTLLNKVLSDFGLNVIPSTVKGVHDLVEATVAKYGADSEEAKQLYAIIPIIGDLIDSVGGFGDAAQQAADQIANATGQITVSVGSVIEDAVGAANTILGNFDNLVGSGTGDFGAKLTQKIALITDAIKTADKTAFPNGTAYEAYINTLKGANANFTTELAEFNRLTQTYSADVAEQLIGLEEWRNQQYDIFKNMPEDLKVVDQIFQQRWDAIVNGTKTGVTAVQQTIEDFIKSLGTLVDQSHGTLGQRLQIEADAGFSKVQDLVAQLAALPPGSPLAAGLQSDITKISVFNGKLVNYIADFTTLTAQYGTDIANQLVALEMWRDTQADTLRSLIADPTQLANALGTLNDIFNDDWKKIVDGTQSGVSDVQKALQGIADYLKGLFVSDVSPLKPQEQFNQAKASFLDDLAKAQGGDVTAINDLPKYADSLLHIGADFLSVSSQAYRDLFAEVTTDLGALAGTQPNGLPLPDTNTAIVAALPTDSKLASSADIQSLAAQVADVETAVANSNTADSKAVQDLLQRILAQMQSSSSTLRANA